MFALFSAAPPSEPSDARATLLLLLLLSITYGGSILPLPLVPPRALEPCATDGRPRTDARPAESDATAAGAGARGSTPSEVRNGAGPLLLPRREPLAAAG